MSVMTLPISSLSVAVVVGERRGPAFRALQPLKKSCSSLGNHCNESKNEIIEYEQIAKVKG
jgi:hypothetical protein